MLGESAVVINTSNDVGEPDQPLVDAVITLPGVELPVRVTVPPEGIETGALTVTLLESAGELSPPTLLATTRQISLDPYTET
jgi:hypothetical protein